MKVASKVMDMQVVESCWKYCIGIAIHSFIHSILFTIYHTGDDVQKSSPVKKCHKVWNCIQMLQLTYRCNNFLYKSVTDTIFFLHNSKSGWMELEPSSTQNIVQRIYIRLGIQESNLLKWPPFLSGQIHDDNNALHIDRHSSPSPL